jgi:hypothetical protein
MGDGSWVTSPSSPALSRSVIPLFRKLCLAMPKLNDEVVSPWKEIFPVDSGLSRLVLGTSPETDSFRGRDDVLVGLADSNDLTVPDKVSICDCIDWIWRSSFSILLISINGR